MGYSVFSLQRLNKIRVIVFVFASGRDDSMHLYRRISFFVGGDVREKCFPQIPVNTRAA